MGADAGGTVGVGVIGLGNRGRYFARVWGEHPQCSVVACCDRDPSVLEQSRRIVDDDAITYYNDMQDMLGDDRVDTVVVATHDRHHTECGIAALQAGKHVFLEKPMAQTVEDCDALIQAWEKAGTVFMVGLELRYCSLCQAMKGILDRGDIGNVKLGYAVDNVSVGGGYYYHGPRRRKEYTISLILEKGTHTIDLMNWFVGSEPVRVYSEGGLDVFGGDASDSLRCGDCAERETCPYAVGERGVEMDYGSSKIQDDGCVYAREVDVDDNSVTSVRYENGAKMTYVECHFTPDYNRHFSLIGTKGRMEAFYNNEQEFRIELTYRHSGRKDVILPEKLQGGHGGGDPAIQKEFLAYVLKGEACCPGILGARNSAAIAIRAAEACETGQVQTIQPYPRRPGITYPL